VEGLKPEHLLNSEPGNNFGFGKNYSEQNSGDEKLYELEHNLGAFIG